MENDKALFTVCFRCGSSEALVKEKVMKGYDSCSVCLHPYIRCMINYDVLPLIEFKPNDYIKERDAIEMIQSVPGSNKADSLFHDAINSTLTDVSEQEGYHPVQIGRENLELFDRADVYIVRDEKNDSIRYFKNMIPEIGIAICHNCCQFFHEEDFEYQYLKQGHCPVCSHNQCSSTHNVRNLKFTGPGIISFSIVNSSHLFFIDILCSHSFRQFSN